MGDEARPRRLGPKRASNIRKLFNLEKKDDVRNFVVRRQIEGKKKTKAPKIQRLITPLMLQRKRRIRSKKIQAVKRAQEERRVWQEICIKRKGGEREARR